MVRDTYKPNTNYVQEVKTTNSAGTVLADDTYTYRADGLKTGAVKYTLNAIGSSDTVTLTGIPLALPEAAAAAGVGYNCATTVLKALYAGWKFW